MINSVDGLSCFHPLDKSIITRGKSDPLNEDKEALTEWYSLLGDRPLPGVAFWDPYNSMSHITLCCLCSLSSFTGLRWKLMS